MSSTTPNFQPRASDYSSCILNGTLSIWTAFEFSAKSACKSSQLQLRLILRCVHWHYQATHYYYIVVDVLHQIAE